MCWKGQASRPGQGLYLQMLPSRIAQVKHSVVTTHAGFAKHVLEHRGILVGKSVLPVTSSSLASFGRLAKRTGVLGSSSFF